MPKIHLFEDAQTVLMSGVPEGTTEDWTELLERWLEGEEPALVLPDDVELVVH